jgi:hypothetical protein
MHDPAEIPTPAVVNEYGCAHVVDVDTGRLCGCNRLKDSDLCFQHDTRPHIVEARLRARSIGGKNSSTQRRAFAEERKTQAAVLDGLQGWDGLLTLIYAYIVDQHQDKTYFTEKYEELVMLESGAQDVMSIRQAQHVKFLKKSVELRQRDTSANVLRALKLLKDTLAITNPPNPDSDLDGGEIEPTDQLWGEPDPKDDPLLSLPPPEDHEEQNRELREFFEALAAQDAQGKDSGNGDPRF